MTWSGECDFDDFEADFVQIPTIFDGGRRHGAGLFPDYAGVPHAATLAVSLQVSVSMDFQVVVSSRRPGSCIDFCLLYFKISLIYI